MARSKTTFQPGVSGNPGGRPSGPRQQLNELLDDVFTPDQRKAVLKKLIVDAKAGNHDARTLLLAYTFGKPTEHKEISGPDGGPLEITDARDQLTTILSRALTGRDASSAPAGDPSVASTGGEPSAE